jgi:hypothetical protein
MNQMNQLDFDLCQAQGCEGCGGFYSATAMQVSTTYFHIVSYTDKPSQHLKT